jgi:hypothetical protein
VQWRVRAVRQLYGTLPNALPVVSVGPWSQTFVSTNPPVSTGSINLLETASDVVGSTAAPLAHSLTPGFVFAGDTATNGVAGRLYRIYVSTDRQCVNVVFTGSVVGSPAYAPRTSGPMALPGSVGDIAKAQTSYMADGGQPGTLSADLRTVTTSEAGGAATTGGGASTGGSSSSSTPASSTDGTATGALVDLWDSGWPTGRYYWTVVPVREVVTGSGLQYVDAEVPQDACAAGRVSAFGKASQPATTSLTRPYASGLSPIGELVAAQGAVPSFYGAALVAWLPALGASSYEVQWSKTKYPWTPASTTPLVTAGTSALLEGLSPGTWYYRVRGIDPYIPGPVKQMTWSTPVRIKLARPKFTIQDGSLTTRHVKK